MFICLGFFTTFDSDDCFLHYKHSFLWISWNDISFFFIFFLSLCWHSCGLGLYRLLPFDLPPRQSHLYPLLPLSPFIHQIYKFIFLDIDLRSGVQTYLCNYIIDISIRSLKNVSDLTWPRPYSWGSTLTSPLSVSPASMNIFSYMS